MRNLEDIENELAAARESLSTVEGTPAEVYSRIVGYYRSVRNWNRGKREEYGERRLYRIDADGLHAAALSASFPAELAAASTTSSMRASPPVKELSETESKGFSEIHLLLFVRSSCPGCSPAKAAAGRLGIPVNLVNADTSDGMAEARRRNVMSTPTAILLSSGGEELKRARDAETIGLLLGGSESIAFRQ